MNDRSARAIVTVPEVAVIDEIKDEIEDVRTFYFSFENREIGRDFRVRSGQFVMCTVFGAGEFAVSLPFSPENDRLHLSVRRVGKVTNALHELGLGDKIGIRGPFGNGFPFEEIKGKNVVYVAGGIGLIPLRSSIVHVLQHRKDFGRILLIYGARTSKDLMFRYMIDEWMKIPGFETYISIDQAEPGWTGEVGFVHTLIARPGSRSRTRWPSSAARPSCSTRSSRSSWRTASRTRPSSPPSSGT